MSRLCEQCRREGRTTCANKELFDQIAEELGEDSNTIVHVVSIGFSYGRSQPKGRGDSFEDMLRKEAEKEENQEPEDSTQEETLEQEQEERQEEEAEDAEWEEAEELVEQD